MSHHLSTVEHVDQGGGVGSSSAIPRSTALVGAAVTLSRVPSPCTSQPRLLPG